MSKGADSALFPLLRTTIDDQTVKHLETFANDGLRTLICAQREIDEETYAEWKPRFEDAKCALIDRSQKVDAAAAEIEQQLEFIGVTAIEDKLQDGVPDTISELLKAGIKVWVLTGDKQETAINIGFACDLLNDAMGLLIIEGDTDIEIQRSLDTMLSIAEQAVSAIEPGEVGLVVNGDRLHSIMDSEALKKIFLKLGMLCKAVVCCRVSPKQKADVVALVKDNLQATTLAIGDGANDVSMIQAAHVGIGISGEEGLQAANAADYCIAQFRFLKRLLLVHGRWSYRRVSKLVLYSFYKQLVLYLGQFWFACFNGFTGTSVHERWTLAIYNLALTAFPIMILGIFDRDVEAHTVLEYPELYHQGHKDHYFNAKVFIVNVLNGVYQSFVCFFIPMLAMMDFTFDDGQTADIFSLGVVVYTCVFFVVTIKVLMEMSGYSVITLMAVVYSICFWFAFLFIHGSFYYAIDIRKCRDFPCSEWYGFLQEFRIVLTARFWLVVPLTVLMAVIRDIYYKVMLRISSTTERGRDLYYDIMVRSNLLKIVNIFSVNRIEEEEITS